MPGDRGIGLFVIGACLLALGLTGCFSGQLGEPCDKESDCDSGLRCYSPPDSSRKFCSVLCENGGCSGGICLSTTDGEVCVPECTQSHASASFCTGGAFCEFFPSDPYCCSGENCFAGQLGESCVDDWDCTEGLICYQPAGSDRKLCTVLCENGSCSDGVCVSTEDDEICVPACIGYEYECPDGLSCQSPTASILESDQDYACWVSDHCLNVENGATSGVEIVKTEIRPSSWNDSAEVSVFVRNTGMEAIQGVYAGIKELPEGVELIECRASELVGSWSSDQCDKPCDCSALAIDLQACQTFPHSLIHFKLRRESADIETPFTVGLIFTDAQGDTWTDSVDVEVAE